MKKRNPKWGNTTAVYIAAFTLLSMLIPGLAHSQDRCSITKFELLQKAKNPKRETPEQFERWMQSRLSAKSASSSPSVMSVITIPVVVHVLHNGASDASNISNAQILSQIDVLNKDFNRQNADAINTPLEFQPVAGDLDVQFVLALQDPEGLPTNGITRTQATQPAWDLNDQSEFKALSYWPAEDYLNIWVIKFATNDIGFAQLPVSTLPGLDDSSEDRLTDGIVVDYRAFGTVDAPGGPFPLDPRFNKGRTSTHEIGHFLGLRHIWGDVSSCSDSDFVPDTPFQNAPTNFCPPIPQTSCGTNKMFMNYMDYTDDACMNIVTDDQVDRMLVVLGASPRRLSLTTSPGATAPVIVSNDLGIRSIISPAATSCVSPLVPQIEIRNYGNNSVTTAVVTLSVDGAPDQTKNYAGSLNPNQLTTLSFDPLAFSPGSLHTVEFEITTTNGVPDANAANNIASVAVSVPQTISLPILELFSVTPPTWTTSNPDGQIGWENVSAPDGSPSNRAMSVDFYSYENEGVLDWILTPSFSLPTPATSLLKFDVAHAQYPGQTDGLRVYALPGCNPNLSQAILLYEKSGSALATVPSSSFEFVPTNATQWRKSEILSLNTLSSSTTWQLAFVSHNGYGNNLYLDNVFVTEDEVNDVALTEITSPGIVHCSSNPAITFLAHNLGTSVVMSFTVGYSINGETQPPQHFTGIALGIGDQASFTLNPTNLQPGPNEISLTLSLPNGIPDIISNNTLSINSVVDQSTDRGPLRMTFDNVAEVPWRVASPINSQEWVAIGTNKAQSLAYKSFTNPELGQESWLVSPTLDLTKGEFSMFFDVSYAQNEPADDRLRVLASTDCGVTYDQILMDRAASSFNADAESTVEWVPGTNDDWHHQPVDISTLAGLSNVRIALVVQNDNGNNLYIDNIELFEGNTVNPPTTPVLYQVYYVDGSSSEVAITFNLVSKKDVRLQVFAMQGLQVSDNLLPDTLNQTYSYDFSNQSSGIYLFRLLIDNQPFVTKVFIGH